jgi:hypothetical protein
MGWRGSSDAKSFCIGIDSIGRVGDGGLSKDEHEYRWL